MSAPIHTPGKQGLSWEDTLGSSMGDGDGL